jgi:hypothetical protein
MQLARWVVRCAQTLQPKADINFLAIHTDWEQWTPNWRDTSDSPEHDLLNFLNHARNLGAKREHDTVYAYLGHPLLQKADGNGPIIMPDYDLPVSQVYLQLTTVLLEQSGLRTLSAIEHDDYTMRQDWPSWVVRWRVEYNQCSFGCYTGFHYRASGENPEQIYKIDDQQLVLRGNVVDKIKYVHQFTVNSSDLNKPEALRTSSPSEHEEVNLDRIWADLRNDNVPCHYPENERLEAFGLTLCSGLTNFARAEDDLEKHNANFSSYWSLRLAATGEDVPTELKSAGQGDPDAFWFDMSLSCEGRTFFITEKGYYGLGPWTTKQGDICSIILGAYVPFVLRPKASSLFRLVGEAYVHGIMAGELVSALENGSQDLIIY